MRPDQWVPYLVVGNSTTPVAEAVRVLLPMLLQPIIGKLITLEVFCQKTDALMSSYNLRDG